MKKTCKAFIFAREGSKGLPNKNVLPLEGISLIERSIKISNSISEIDQTFLSTDIGGLEYLKENYNLEIINRPKSLTTDKSPEWLSWQHAIQYVFEKYGEFDSFLSLPPTAPLRSKEDIQRTIKALSKDVDVVVTFSEAKRSPWFNMIMKDDKGEISLVSQESIFFRRQDTPKCFDMATVAYAARPEFVLRSQNLWEGKVAGVQIPTERAIDIDNELDFKIASFLLRERGI